MTTSRELTWAPLLLAELCYFDIPRDAWARTLLRARQLGAITIITSVNWRWHAPTPDAIDLNGTSNPQRDLVGFVKLCGRLNICLILNVGAIVGENVFRNDIPSWLEPAPFAEHTLRSKLVTELSAEYQVAARRWVAVCSRTLLPHQSPQGPIVALRLAGDPQLRGWLQDEGWTAPISMGQPSYTDPWASSAAALPGNLSRGANLLSQPTLRSSSLSRPPMLRSDGSARQDFWRTKSMYMLIGAAGFDFAAARAPADLALLADADIEPLGQRLADAGITFDRLEPSEVTSAQLAQYTLLIAAGALAEQPGTRAKLANCANLALIGACSAALTPALQLADDISADRVSELIEARGGHARYAWADNRAIGVGVRYGPQHTYVLVDNRQAAAYNGMLAYRAPGGEVLHVHVGIGAGRSGIVMLREDEVVGAAIDGDGAEGGWLARGLTTSMVFNAGAGGIAPCGRGLLLTAPQSGRFQIRRGDGWAEMRAYRLLLSGELMPARVQIDAAHVLLPYTAEDNCGQTDMYLVLPGEHTLLAELRAYLATPLHARAFDLEAAAELANDIAPAAVPGLRAAARALADSAARFTTIADYAAARRAADLPIQSILTALEDVDDKPTAAGAANTISRILRLVAGEAN